jgi:tetratricopeptide (TPR) repeat protein
MERFRDGELVRRNLSLATAVALALVLGACSGPREKGEDALAMGDGERASRFLALALDGEPSDSLLRRQLGEANLLVARVRAEDGEDKPQDWSKAVREFELAPKSDTSYRSLLEESRFGLARCLLRAGDTDRAEHKLEAILEHRPRATRVRNLLAIVVDRRGDPDRAAELFLQNTAIDTTDVDAYFNLALVEWNRGRKLVAIDHIVKASRLAPKDPEILWWLERMVRVETGR